MAVPLPPPDSRALDRAAELIRAASRPIVIAGFQCRPEDAGWLRAFAEALPAPVLITSQVEEALPEAHPLALGIFTGGEQDDAVLGLADLIVTFGLGPTELNPPRWPYPALVVCLTRTPPSSLPFTPLVEVVGELALILEELAPRLRGQKQADWDVFQLDRLKKAGNHSSRGLL
jgi:thiamine pyrophosphate-dependent acetolactate synthase large subunit-like protein